jgi:ABC-type dipeptide/oligopeptide/nickel transport system ATPase subunit
MTIAEILQIADRLVFSQTGKHLDDLQEAVIKGVWQGQTYQVIADECQHSESRVRDVGYKLWEILSEQLGEDINKCNFRSTFERLDLTSSQFINIIQSIENFRFCSYTNQSLNNDRQAQSNQQQPYCDLKQAPKINHCYGRENELSTLSQWLENPNTQLISVLGIAGIGKSTLVRHFLDINTQTFDAIIWKNLKLSSLDSIVTEISTNIQANNAQQNINDNISEQFLNLLIQKRCLIILDNLEEIFTPQQLAGMYKTEYKYKQPFLRMITEMEHQSCFILISQEKCQEMISLDDELYPSHCLELAGLDESAREILRNQDLKDEESWLKLIILYEGHPKYLQNISILIKEVFAGKVSDFLQEKSLILTEDIKHSLTELYNRLSPIEKQIALELSRHEQAISRKDLRQSLSLLSTDLINGLQSLNRRYLVITIKGDKILFKLSPIFIEYVKNCCQD